MREFCTKHGYYSCPVCRGEEEVWVIPIVDGADHLGLGGNVVGTISISERSVEITGNPELPSSPAQLSLRIPGQEPLHVAHVEPEPDRHLLVKLPPVPEPAEPLAPELVEKIKESFSTYERLMQTPEGQAAAARGRIFYERALALAEAEGIPMPEALERVGEEEE